MFLFVCNTVSLQFYLDCTTLPPRELKGGTDALKTRVIQGGCGWHWRHHHLCKR